MRHLCGLSSALQTRKHISHQRPSGRLCHGYGCGPPPSGRRRTCGARWPRAPSVISLRVAFGGVGAPGRGTPGVAAVSGAQWPWGCWRRPRVRVGVRECGGAGPRRAGRAPRAAWRRAGRVSGLRARVVRGPEVGLPPYGAGRGVLSWWCVGCERCGGCEGCGGCGGCGRGAAAAAVTKAAQFGAISPPASTGALRWLRNSAIRRNSGSPKSWGPSGWVRGRGRLDCWWRSLGEPPGLVRGVRARGRRRRR